MQERGFRVKGGTAGLWRKVTSRRSQERARRKTYYVTALADYVNKIKG